MPPIPRKGRGAISRREGRFEKRQVELDPEEASGQAATAPETTIFYKPNAASRLLEEWERAFLRRRHA